MKNPGILNTATWVQFHFNPPITLTPGQLHYFDGREVPSPDQYHYEWFFWSLADAYLPRTGLDEQRPIQLGLDV